MDALQISLEAIFKKHAGTRENGRVASQRSESARREAIKACFGRLKVLGYELQKPENISEKHIKALCEFWHEKAMHRRRSKALCLICEFFPLDRQGKNGEERALLPARG